MIKIYFIINLIILIYYKILLNFYIEMRIVFFLVKDQKKSATFRRTNLQLSIVTCVLRGTISGS